MLHDPIAPPRRLKRAWLVVRHGLPSLGRYRRYLVALSIPLAFIWLLTLLYLVAAPVSYTSKMTLILPGSGVGGSLNVDQLGQASSVTASAFSSPTLSPTENYKRLLMADVTLERAAARLHIPTAAFPKPDVKLTDQTNLIEVSVKGRTAAAAHDRLEALRWAFLASLDMLRAQEATERERASREEIARLQLKAREAQHRLLDFQAKSGLISIEQFNARIAALDALRDKYRQALTTQRQQDAQTSRLSHALGAGVGQRARPYCSRPIPCSSRCWAAMPRSAPALPKNPPRWATGTRWSASFRRRTAPCATRSPRVARRSPAWIGTSCCALSTNR
jgi:hypothetical protein